MVRKAVTVPPGGMAWRSFNFRPRDPDGVSQALVARARRLLADYNPRLNLFWSPWAETERHPDVPGRWRVVEWLPNLANWTTAFFLKGPGGEYRSPEPMEPHLERLKRGDQRLRDAAAEVDAHNARVDELRRRELREALREYWDDWLARFGPNGTRQTFGPGRLRTRAAVNGQARAFKNGDHERFLRQMGLIR